MARIAGVDLPRDKRVEAMDILRRIQRIELPVQPEFQDRFMAALYFPHMTDHFPNLEGIAPKREESNVAERLFRK